MTATARVTTALVRGIPDTFDNCIKPPESRQPIDLALARRQHHVYCETLRRLGLRLIEIEADPAYPDCVFVEDTAVAAGGTVVLSRFGVEARSGEEEAVANVLEKSMRLFRIPAPGIIEGGDVLRIGKTFFVGLTARTNREGAFRLRDAVAAEGFDVVSVPVTGVLHLKSAVTYLGRGHVALCPGYFDPSVFSAFDTITIPPGELYAANCLAVNETVLVSEGFPESLKAIRTAGFDTREIPTSEFKKAGGSLTCLSILL